MKKMLLLGFLATIALFSCKDEDDTPVIETGSLEIEFDNVAIVNDIQQQLTLANIGDDNYEFENGMGQKYNVTLLKYYITKIVLEGPNGELYEDRMSVSATESEGYYLIDEGEKSTQLITLENVPPGTYNKVSFTVGVDEDGVIEGAAGGALDPATSQMFWNWNAGYIAMKFEGQSDVSNGGANGELTFPEHEFGLVYHVGGWKDVPDQPFVYNNQRLSFEFDTDAKVASDQLPHVHMIFDVLSLFKGTNTIDFTGNHNVHKPADGTPVAENIPAAFAYDHVHQ
jgi:hypothetical protein